ncbi:hypothetical protein DQ04_12861010 [Trypanosoma grayi]|uniref:hypothetical protein n=1 Tax=Trypanosoma grayi TaxID=71804 RepID=UPI0004F43E45|nr:hypothetical protein DQ04_12861010 [Trypanosoma grayi]KEG06658.1 hypothetical protein DQ04_12861010 [Trypanosoma grayi]
MDPPTPNDSAFHKRRGALACAAAAVIERDLDPQLLSQFRKHADPIELPRSTARCIGPWVALGNKMAHLTAYVWTRSANGRCLHGPIRTEGRSRENFFKGHSILRRTHRTRVADKNGERRFPLQQVDVDTLSPHWVWSQLNSKVLERFNTLWGLAQHPAKLGTGEREPLLRMAEGDAQVMKKAVIIQTAPKLPATG